MSFTLLCGFLFSSRRRHTRCALVTGVQTCALPIYAAYRSAASPSEVEAAKIYRNYSATLAAYQSVDFDDLIRLPAMLLEHNEQVRQRWQAQVHYLLVDEYQDTNVCQYR